MLNSGEITPVDREVIGKHPDQETHEVYQAKSKSMELAFYENANRFELYIQKIDGVTKNPGDTTKLFAEMVKKIQAKADELGQPVTLVLDPIKDVIVRWARHKAVEIIGQWDTDENGKYFRKTFYPRQTKTV